MQLYLITPSKVPGRKGTPIPASNSIKSPSTSLSLAISKNQKRKKRNKTKQLILERYRKLYSLFKRSTCHNYSYSGKYKSYICPSFNTKLLLNAKDKEM